VVSGCNDFILMDFSCIDLSARAFNTDGTPSRLTRRLAYRLSGAPARSEGCMLIS
jgi:hypothetical protein